MNVHFSTESISPIPKPISVNLQAQIGKNVENEDGTLSFTHSLYQMDSQRLRYSLARYLRTRYKYQLNLHSKIYHEVHKMKFIFDIFIKKLISSRPS